MEKQFRFDYEHYAALSELPEADRLLVSEAEQATARACAPYSKFRVGAAARLRSGRILHGSNIESEVFPAGLCAERTLLFHAAANHADDYRCTSCGNSGCGSKCTGAMKRIRNRGTVRTKDLRHSNDSFFQLIKPATEAAGVRGTLSSALLPTEGVPG